MRPARRSPSLVALSLLGAGLLSLTETACFRPPRPQPPLWPSDRYSRVLVLPVRMTVSTGTPPFTTPDTELGGRQGDLAQQALTLVFRARGYEVVNPFDANERIGKDRELVSAAMALAGRAGYLGPEVEFGSGFVPGPGGETPSLPPSPAPPLDGGEAARLGKAFGADLLVIAGGEGEFHGLGESLVTALVSKGRQSAPPSRLRFSLTLVDAASGATVGRFAADSGWTEKLETLAGALERDLRGIPGRGR